MRIGRRLIRKEEGNILYLTLIMMMVLVLMALVLVNVIQMAVLRIKAQQAADHMVLSAATLKARLLNNFANKNSFMQALLQTKGTRDNPFNSNTEAKQWKNTLENLTHIMSVETTAFSSAMIHSEILETIAQENGLNEKTSRVRLYPEDIKPDLEMRTTFRRAWVADPSFPQNKPIDLPACYEPKTPLYVQARVEWQTKEMIIGHRLLKVNLPDIITRARAEIVDAGILKSPAGRCWRVRLMPPQPSVDEYLKNQ